MVCPGKLGRIWVHLTQTWWRNVLHFLYDIYVLQNKIQKLLGRWLCQPWNCAIRIHLERTSCEEQLTDSLHLLCLLDNASVLGRGPFSGLLPADDQTLGALELRCSSLMGTYSSRYFLLRDSPLTRQDSSLTALPSGRSSGSSFAPFHSCQNRSRSEALFTFSCFISLCVLQRRFLPKKLFAHLICFSDFKLMQ